MLRLSDIHKQGLCGLEPDEKKAKEYLDKSAGMGNCAAFFDLGRYERRKGNHHKSIYYFRISASLGFKEALEIVKLGYKAGLVSKDDFAKTLRAYQRAQDEMRSETRDVVAQAKKLQRLLVM